MTVRPHRRRTLPSRSMLDESRAGQYRELVGDVVFVDQPESFAWPRQGGLVNVAWPGLARLGHLRLLEGIKAGGLGAARRVIHSCSPRIAVIRNHASTSARNMEYRFDSF